jgi:hypothetical protein
MAKKEETYPEGYPRQQEKFSEEQKFKFDVFEAIKQIALDTTEDAFESEGYKEKGGRAGEYSTGDSYGVGTSLHHFNIRLSSRPNTNTYFEKIIYFGGKKAITDVNIGWDAANKTIELAYKNSEFSAFRGYGSKIGAQLVNERSNFVIKSLPAFKKELKELFKSFAEKEVAYITSTKIGIEDKTEKSINSMVETSMKKFSLKNLMTSSDEDLSSAVDKYISEGKEGIDKDEKTRMNSPEVIAANSKDKLLFDDVEELEEGDFKTAAKNGLKKFGVVAVNELKPSEKKAYFEALEKELTIKEEGPAVGGGATISGDNAAGSAFTGPVAFKKGGDLNLEANEKLAKTPYAQGQKQRASVTKTMKEGDSFWATVELTPGSGYVPKGMDHNYVVGQHEKNLNESMQPKKQEDKSIIKESLIKRKFTSLNENEEKGINKRYIVTEQRSSDEQTDRWKKLSLFETYETINAAENCGCGAEDLGQVSMEQGQEENEREFMQRNSDAEAGGEVDGREVVVVAKPGSLSNAMFKVFKDDYLNEGKAYILDLNSGNLVSNPSFKSKK